MKSNVSYNLALAAALAGSALSAQDSMHRDEYTRLAEATARGDSVVSLVIASREGQNEAVVRALASIGGVVCYRDDDVSYVRARIPTAKALSVASVVAIERVSVEVLSNRSAPKCGTPATAFERIRNKANGSAMASRVAPSLPSPIVPSRLSPPMERPYHPLNDMGGADLRRAHPTYDGRGVVVGVVEGGIDLSAPELKYATTLDGKPVPKVVDVVDTYDPSHMLAFYDARPDIIKVSKWVSMHTEVEAALGSSADATFRRGDTVFVAPRAGRFSYGVRGSLRDDCRDIVAHKVPWTRIRQVSLKWSPCPVAILWDRRTNEVWVDTDRDRSFADEKVMQDYAVRLDYGVLGEDDALTRQRETTTFVVQTDPAGERVALLYSSAHGTSVASSVAASRGTVGRVEGIAPGAQLISLGVQAFSWGAYVESFIRAMKDPRVDVITASLLATYEGGYTPRDGRSPIVIILDRLIEKYSKPIVRAVGNAPHFANVSEGSLMRWGFGVGGSQSAESWWRNHGLRTPEGSSQMYGRGPGGDGRLSPTVLAPGRWLAANDPRGSDAFAGVQAFGEKLPPGYVIFGGTSQATPTLAGGLAILINAAKQERIPYDAKRLWYAVTNTARFDPTIPAYKQGNGTVDIGAALTLLRKYANNPPAIMIESTGPVRTRHSHDLKTPHQGVSLFEMDGWSAGMKGTRTVTLTRTSGAPTPMKFQLSWLGNTNATFTVADAVSLPLNQSVPVEVMVEPKTIGVHSAILRIDNPSVPGDEYRMMMTVVASEQFTPSNGYTVAISDTIERWNTASSHFLNIPSGVAALTRTVAGGLTMNGEMRRTDPDGQEVYEMPLPGTLEVSVRAQDGGYYAVNEVDLRWHEDDLVALGKAPDPPVTTRINASVLGASTRITKPLSRLDAGGHAALEVEVENQFAAFTGSVARTALGSSRVMRHTLKPHEHYVYTIEVPAGAPMIEAKVESAVPPGVELSVHLLDCTNKNGGVLRDFGCVTADYRSRQRLMPLQRKRQPNAGTWKVVISGANIPAEGIDVEVRDVVFDPALGSVSTTDVAKRRGLGERWKAQVGVWQVAAPSAGRELVVPVITEAKLGDGTAVPVSVQYLSPR